MNSTSSDDSEDQAGDFREWERTFAQVLHEYQNPQAAFERYEAIIYKYKEIP